MLSQFNSRQNAANLLLVVGEWILWHALRDFPDENNDLKDTKESKDAFELKNQNNTFNQLKEQDY